MIDTSETVKGITLIKVGRATFVSGLYWQILSSPRAAVYMPEARRLAREERLRSGMAMDVVAVRENRESVQAGFVARGAGAKRGMYSLAAIAADVIGGSFIAAFDLLNGRIAVVAAMDGAIIPDSDQVLDHDAAAELVRVLWNDLSGTTKDGEKLVVYAPESIFAGASPPDIADLLPGLKRTQRLRPLSRFSKHELVVGGAIALFTIAGLWILNAMQAHQAEQERLASEARALELERIRKQSGRDAKEVALNHLWSATPAPSVFLGHCTQALWSLPVTLAGWPLATANCTAPGSVRAVYLRGKGLSSTEFRAKLANWRTEASATFLLDGAAATIEFNVPMPAGGDDSIRPISARAEAFSDHVRKSTVPLQVVEKPSSFPPNYRPVPIQGESPAAPDWRTFQWDITNTNRSPASFLDGMPDDGIRIHSISLGFSNTKLVWSASGEIYGN